MAGSTTIQMRVPDDLLGRIDEACSHTSRTSWFLGLAERELDDAGPGDLLDPDTFPAAPLSPLASLPVTTEVQPGGIPSPGVICSWARCMDRNTHRFGVLDPAELTRGGYLERPRDEELCGHALCPQHAGRLSGFRYVRPTAAPRSQAARQPGPVTA